MCSSEGTAQAELQLLREIENTLKESAVPHVMVYATQPSAAYPSPTRRSLLAAKQQQPQFVCDATCQTQVPCYVTCISYQVYIGGRTITVFCEYHIWNITVHQSCNGDLAELCFSKIFPTLQMLRGNCFCRSSSSRASFLQ